MEKLPRWDLTPLYPGCDSTAFRRDLEKVVSDANALKTALSDVQLDLHEAITRYELVLDYLENLEAYSSACLTTDTANELFVQAVSQTQEASLVVEQLQVAFLNYLASHAMQVRERCLEGNDLALYRFPLQELLERQKHVMSPELEDLASDLARCGTDAFSRLQEGLSSGMETTWDEGLSKTVIQLRNEATNPDRSIRKKAFEKELGLWEQFQIPFAAALNGVKGATLSLDERRNYASPLARSLMQSRIDEEILDALLGTLKDSLPLFRSYLKGKAKLLGVDGLAFYDLFAPVGERTSTYTYEQAHQFIVKQFSLFSAEMGEFADHAFKANWIDAESRKGKVGGAYDTAFPLAKQSRILSNFDGTYNGVSTLAHELGHAWHDHVVLEKSHLLRSYPMTLAETASIFSEFLVLQGALETCSKEERLGLVEHFLQDATQVCVDILSRFEFESEVFARRKEGELTAQNYCSMMEEAQKHTYGDALVVYHPYMWAVKGHYYSSDFSFYNYPYAFGQLFALGLYAQSKKIGPAFSEQYRSLLASTGSLPAKDVAKLVGIDLSSRAFWESAIAVIAEYVGEFEHALSH